MHCALHFRTSNRVLVPLQALRYLYLVSRQMRRWRHLGAVYIGVGDPR